MEKSWFEGHMNGLHIAVNMIAMGWVRWGGGGGQFLTALCREFLLYFILVSVCFLNRRYFGSGVAPADAQLYEIMISAMILK